MYQIQLIREHTSCGFKIPSCLTIIYLLTRIRAKYLQASWPGIGSLWSHFHYFYCWLCCFCQVIPSSALHINHLPGCALNSLANCGAFLRGLDRITNISPTRFWPLVGASYLQYLWDLQFLTWHRFRCPFRGRTEIILGFTIIQCEYWQQSTLLTVCISHWENLITPCLGIQIGFDFPKIEFTEISWKVKEQWVTAGEIYEKYWFHIKIWAAWECSH